MKLKAYSYACEPHYCQLSCRAQAFASFCQAPNNIPEKTWSAVWHFQNDKYCKSDTGICNLQYICTCMKVQSFSVPVTSWILRSWLFIDCHDAFMKLKSHNMKMGFVSILQKCIVNHTCNYTRILLHSNTVGVTNTIYKRKRKNLMWLNFS